MTALEAIAVREAAVTYDAARRRHERDALLAYRAGRPVRGYVEAAAARRLRRHGPAEVMVIREIG